MIRNERSEKEGGFRNTTLMQQQGRDYKRGNGINDFRGDSIRGDIPRDPVRGVSGGPGFRGDFRGDFPIRGQGGEIFRGETFRGDGRPDGRPCPPVWGPGPGHLERGVERGGSGGGNEREREREWGEKEWGGDRRGRDEREMWGRDRGPFAPHLAGERVIERFEGRDVVRDRERERGERERGERERSLAPTLMRGVPPRGNFSVEREREWNIGNGGGREGERVNDRERLINDRGISNLDRIGDDNNNNYNNNNNNSNNNNNNMSARPPSQNIERIMNERERIEWERDNRETREKERTYRGRSISSAREERERVEREKGGSLGNGIRVHNQVPILQRSQSDGGLGSSNMSHLGTNLGNGLNNLGNISTNINLGGIRDIERRDPNNNFRVKDRNSTDNILPKRTLVKPSDTKGFISQIPQSPHTVPIPGPGPPLEPYVPKPYGQRNENDFYLKNSNQPNPPPLPSSHFPDSSNSVILGARSLGYGPNPTPPPNGPGLGPPVVGVIPIPTLSRSASYNNNIEMGGNNNNNNNNNSNNNNSNNNNLMNNFNNFNSGGLGFGTNERLKEKTEIKEINDGKINDIVINENIKDGKEKNIRNDFLTGNDKESSLQKDSLEKSKELTPVGSFPLGSLISKPAVPQLLIRVINEKGDVNSENAISVNTNSVISTSLSSSSLYRMHAGKHIYFIY